MSSHRVDDRPQDEPLDPSRVVPYRRWTDPAIDNDMRIFPTLPEGLDPSTSLWTSGLQSPGTEKASEETSTGGWLSGLVQEEVGAEAISGGAARGVAEGLGEGASGGADDSGRQRRTWQSDLDFSEESLVGEETPSTAWLAGLVKVEKRPALNDIARLLFGGESSPSLPAEASASSPVSPTTPPTAPPTVSTGRGWAFPAPSDSLPVAEDAPRGVLSLEPGPPGSLAAPAPTVPAESWAFPSAPPTAAAGPSASPPTSPIAPAGPSASRPASPIAPAEPSAFPAAPPTAPVTPPPSAEASSGTSLPALEWPVKTPEPTGPSAFPPPPPGSGIVQPRTSDPAAGNLQVPRPARDEERVILPRGLESTPAPATPLPSAPPSRGSAPSAPISPAAPAPSPRSKAAPLEIDLLAAPRPTAPPAATGSPGGAASSAPAQPTVSRMVTGKISGRDRVSFYRALAAMFEAGVPVFAIFEFLSREGESQALCDACRRMGQNLVTGMALNMAAMQEPDLFDIKSVRMLEVGYKGGQLEQILRQLADDEEHAWGLRQSLKSQLTYPCGIAMMTMLAVLLMPPLVLTDLLEQVVSLTKEPPMLTRWLLNFSAFLSSPWTIGAAGLLIIGVVLWFRSPKGRKMVDNAELTYWFVPGLGPLWRNVVGLRFLRVFSMVYQAGLPASAGLELAASATGSQLAYRVAPLMKRTLIDGGTLTDAFAAGGFLPGLALESVMAGESSGNVPVMLDNSAMILEAEVQSRVDAVAKLIEPLVLAVLGVIVGVFVLGCLLPIVELTSTL